MKIIRILIISLIFMLFLGNYLLSDSKEWKNIHSSYFPGGGNSFNSIRCADSLNCFVWVDYKGQWGYKFVRTTDGGKSWEIMYQDSNYFHSSTDYKELPELTEIAYPDTNLFIAVGDSGTIIRTTDKGKTWNKPLFDKQKGIFNIRMLDNNYGIIMTYDQPIHKVELFETTNSGNNWQLMNLPSNSGDLLFFDDYQIINRNLFYALIRYKTSEPLLLRVYNNWETWDTISRNYCAQYMSFVNEKKGWIGGGCDLGGGDFKQQILYTEDSGNTWTMQRDTDYNTFSIQGISMFDENFGMANCGCWSVLETYNGGKTWIEASLHGDTAFYGICYNEDYWDIQVPSLTNAYMIGDGFYIWKFTRDWSKVSVAEPLKEGSPPVIFPNPASDYIEITNYQLPITSISIYNMLGEEVLKLNINSNQNKIKLDVSAFAQGIYFCKVNLNGSIFAYKEFIIIK